MNNKKICVIVLFLAVMTILFAVLSCNNPEKDIVENNGDKNSEAGSGESSGTSLASADYDGYEFKIFGFMSYGPVFKAVTYSEVQAETINSDPINDSIFNRNAIIEEMYNITIKEILYGEISDAGDTVVERALRLVRAGDDEFDAGLSPGYTMPRIIGGQNITHDLLTIPELDLSQPWWDQNCIKEFTLANKLNSVTGDISLWNTMATTVFYFNKKLVEDNSFESPYALVKRGDWTWDVFADMSRDVTKDTSGDGKIDRFDQIGITSESGTMLQAVWCAGERITYKDEDDLPVMNINIDRIVNILDKAMPILRSVDYAYASSDLYGRYPNPYFDFTLPKFQNNETLFYTQQLMVVFELREMEADFGVLPFPKYDKAQEKYSSVASDYFVKYVWLPQTNSEPGRAANILQALGHYSREMVTPAFFDITVTNKALRDEESRDMLEIIMNNRIYDLASIYNWGDITGIYNSIYDKRRNDLASQYESKIVKIEAEMQKTVDELF